MGSSDTEARKRVLREQNELILRLRQDGRDDVADRLEETYHAREMSRLAADVYGSAKHEGIPPLGWHRASLDPEALRAAGVDLSDQEIRGLLQPRHSGFRAEIYVPDKAILGDNTRPVVVYKGSTGEIIDPSAPSGRRESGGEDFLNNGQQAIGMRSDYYDRAMRLGALLNQKMTGNFEIAGHSLGGGMASAASAVTGARATTFNAAGLHPDTPARFAKDNGLPTFNPQQTVHTYQTVGEVLNDVQAGLQRLNEQQRRGYGLLANETSKLLREPLLQSRVTETMREMLPPGAQTAAAQFVEQLATKPGNEALRNVPVAAGRMEILLDAKTRDANGNVVDRAQVAAPSQVAELAGPLSTVLVAGAHGMRGGRLAGEHIERMGALGGKGLDVAGDVVQQVATVQGRAVGSVVDFGGATLSVGAQNGAAVLAQGRELVGQVEAIKHRVEGYRDRTLGDWGAKVVGWMGAEEMAERVRQVGARSHAEHGAKAEQATRQATGDAAAIREGGEQVAAHIKAGAQWTSDGLRNGYAQYGATVNQATDWSGRQVVAVTSHAPGVLASLGGAGTALGTAAVTHTPSVAMPQNLRNLVHTARFSSSIGAAFGEATARHGMIDTVIPSLDAEIEKQEAAARRLLEARAQAPVTAARPLLNDPAHPDFHLFKGAQNGVHRLDAAHDRTPDLHSDQLAGALAAQARQDGLKSIAHVVLSHDCARAFAVDTADLSNVHQRRTHVEVMTGLSTPLSESTARIEALTASQGQPALGAPAMQPPQQDQAAPAMG